MNYKDRLINLGKRIAKERGRKGWTQSQLCEEMYFSSSSVSTIRNWEKGIKAPSLENIFKLSDLFGCDVGYLLGDYDTRTWEAADIFEATGINQAAVDFLRTLGQQERYFFARWLSNMIANLDFTTIQQRLIDIVKLANYAVNLAKSSGDFSILFESENKVTDDGKLSISFASARNYAIHDVVDATEKAAYKAFDITTGKTLKAISKMRESGELE